MLCVMGPLGTRIAALQRDRVIEFETGLSLLASSILLEIPQRVSYGARGQNRGRG